MTAARRRSDPDPYPNYAWLRENVPVSAVYSPSRTGSTWLVTGYEDAKACLADPRLSNDDRHAGSEDNPFPEGDFDMARGLLDLDRPEHARLRKMVSAPFTTAAVEQLRPMMRQVCETAVDEFVASGGTDLVAGYCVPVPVAVIHEVLGLPVEQRESPLRCLDLFYRAGFVQPLEAGAVEELVGYVRHIVEYKRANPGPDLTTLLLRKLDEGDLRSEAELVSMMLSVLGAGHVTTVQFLGTATLRLLEHPSQLAALRAGSVSWQDSVNEMLRYDSPVQASTYRYALTDLEVAGTPIAKGDAVLISLASANRDGSRYEDPNAFQLDRKARSNLAFGHGAHLCLGAQLARVEGEIALDVLFERLPGLRLDIPVADVVWSYGPMLRGPYELPVTQQ